MKKTIETINTEIRKLEEQKRKLYELAEKKRLAEKNKDKISLDKLKNYAVTDVSCIWGIFPFIERYSGTPDKFTLKDEEYSEFKDKVSIISEGFGKEEKINIGKSRFSREYIQKAIEIVKLLGYPIEDESVHFYVQKNKQGEIIKDKAILMVVNCICFMFAPRVESD